VSRTVLTLNAGSSSLKFSLYGIEDAPSLISQGQIAGIGTAPHFRAGDVAGAILAENRWPNGQKNTHEDFLEALLRWIKTHLSESNLTGVGHRIVHGGMDFTAPILLEPAIVAALNRLIPLAPLHQPHNLNAVMAIAKLRPDLPQVACFDTAFHHTMTQTAARFAVPREIERTGVKRYGFHGLSYEYIAGQLRNVAPALASKRVVVAHLGSGASLCALLDGRSVDTTMGLTPLDGLVMGTRCGSIDPGCLFYLMRQHGMDAAKLEDMLYHQSGLLGVSSISGDMRALLASTDPHAREAIDLFTFRIAREIGALCATLGGLDGLVFTAGIGENSPEIRRQVCKRMAWMGVVLDPEANCKNAGLVSALHSPVAVLVIPTNEELVIARHTKALIA
jgi:acetate kinase